MTGPGKGEGTKQKQQLMRSPRVSQLFLNHTWKRTVRVIQFEGIRSRMEHWFSSVLVSGMTPLSLLRQTSISRRELVALTTYPYIIEQIKTGINNEGNRERGGEL